MRVADMDIVDILLGTIVFTSIGLLWLIVVFLRTQIPHWPFKKRE